ncbi:MAG TPA: TfpX/TfpZ family type IV pilin accessory protein [Burkholderiales bacterium]|nr:TfpX/TfpZ family type IV pilin accessory protein [Burkholderiales bacterium]
MSRWRAAGIHLLISAGIAAGVLALMLGVWYGPTLFRAMGGTWLALILIGVDVVLGPALTLVVFRSGKRGLKFDLVAIALLQIAALAYGCYVVSLARPAFIVFVKDQFQVATVAELDPEQLAKARYPQYRSPPWSGPELVFGEWPKDHEEQQQLMFAGLAGVDLQHFPKYYAPYEQGRDQILARAQPLSSVGRLEPAAAKAIDAWLASAGADPANLRYLRLRGRIAWVAVLIDARSAAPVKMLLAEKL